MSEVKGYVVCLNKQREEAFKRHSYESFGEPVNEFIYDTRMPLICFVISSQKILTHIALGKRGYSAGTDANIRRLNLDNIFKLTTVVTIDKLVCSCSTRIKKELSENLDKGGLISPENFDYLLNRVSKLDPDLASILLIYSKARTKKIKSLPLKVQVALAVQKEAIATVMAIAGFDKEKLLGWDVDSAKNKGHISYINGINPMHINEDAMIGNDMHNLPGYKILKGSIISSAVFRNHKSKLTVLLANRNPLENQLGVDLIYYNETFSCYLMIQYKAMNEVYRFPNEQLTKGIERMDRVLSDLKKVPANSDVKDFRLNENPFFLKICSKIVFEPDNTGLVKGMYLPLEYWKRLSNHPTMIGPRGGKSLSYKNVRRYFNNTEFLTMASGGWIGTNINQSKELETYIGSILATGQQIIFAVNSEKYSQRGGG